MAESNRVHKIMESIGNTNRGARRLIYNKKTKKIEPSNQKDPDNIISFDQQDMDLSGGDETSAQIITISEEILQKMAKTPGDYKARFSSRDEGTVFGLLKSEQSGPTVAGRITVGRDMENVDMDNVEMSSDFVRLFVKKGQENNISPNTSSSTDSRWQVKGYVLKDGVWDHVPVQIIPVIEHLFSRFKGLLETSVLSDKRVLLIGVGSVGSEISKRLAQTGFMKFGIADHDRLEVGNVARHAAGISDVGRYKVHAVKDLICEKNPYAEVQTHTAKVSWENMESFRLLVRNADIVVCVPDDRTAKRVINRLCLEEGKVLIIAGAFRRAYGGQVLRIRPEESLCFECFLNSLPEQANDEEIASIEKAAGLAYTDRPVPIEPGLANDIAPINQMVVKLVINEFSPGTLSEDLVAPLYFWLNKREEESPYANLKPMEFCIDGVSVLRWYGIDISPNPACPECGDFVGEMAKHYGVTVPE